MMSHLVRGTKRPAESSETLPAKRNHIEVNNVEVPEIEMVGSSDDEVTTGPIHRQRVIIELAENPKPPAQTMGSGSSTRQATFDDMEWNITKTEGERQERLQKDAEEWREETEADWAQEAEEKSER